MAPTAKPVINEKKTKSKPNAWSSSTPEGAPINGERQMVVNPGVTTVANGNQLENIERLQRRLWDAADELRANSKLTANEYCMPCLGVIFLRHAANRYNEALCQIEADQAAGKMPKRPLTSADFKKRGAMMLPDLAQYEQLIALPKGSDLSAALVAAMDAIEAEVEGLVGQLPKDYTKFENSLLEDLLRIFDSDELHKANGDVFGRINEYFLMKFAMQGAQDNGEFFTPPSLVQTIVNIIEPDHGIVFDPAAGSGGMFVQTGHFLQEHGENAARKVTFYGHEFKTSNLRLAKMNLAVHALEGKIDEANTFYDDPHELFNKCDFVMANPPFNVDKVDAEKVKTDRRLPFGLPGVNKAEKVSNGNYLWISYFWSYLNDHGRAGFVMSSQASSAGKKEAEVRRKIVETGDVDVIISIRSNFFYTRTVPCELWHFDRAKPIGSGRNQNGSVLMVDARNVYRKVTRKIYDFSPEQLQNLTSIVWLYRGQNERFVNLVQRHMDASLNAANECFLRNDEGVQPIDPLGDFVNAMKELGDQVKPLIDSIGEETPHDEVIGNFIASDSHGPVEQFRFFTGDAWKHWNQSDGGLAGLRDYHDNILVHLSAQSHDLISMIDTHAKAASRLVDLCEGALNARDSKEWQSRHVNRALRLAKDARDVAIAHLRRVRYFQRHAAWLIERFPDGEFVAVPGLCRVVNKKDIEAADWSLTPGRFVGVAPPEIDEDFDFGQAMADIHSELGYLNSESMRLVSAINKNFERLAE